MGGVSRLEGEMGGGRRVMLLLPLLLEVSAKKGPPFTGPWDQAQATEVVRTSSSVIINGQSG
jgi:hypothetical protein